MRWLSTVGDVDMQGPPWVGNAPDQPTLEIQREDGAKIAIACESPEEWESIKRRMDDAYAGRDPNRPCYYGSTEDQ